MPDETYYAVVNDNSAPTSREHEECITFCRDGAGNPIITHEKSDALELRDRHREGYDNPDINVYELTIHEGRLERDTEGGA